MREGAGGDRTSPGPSGRRAALAILTGGAAAALGALILGEYEFTGATPYIAGVLFGLIVGEVTLTVAQRSRWPLVLSSAVESGFGLVWAVWISTGRGRAPVPTGADVAVAIGALVAGAWVALPARRRAGAPLDAP